MAELWTSGRPILDGKVELDQLDKIFTLCGSIDEQQWPNAQKLLASSSGISSKSIKNFKKKPRQVSY